MKKIDIYLYSRTGKYWAYECSTNWFKTCKQAKIRFCQKHGLDNDQVKCSFAKS